MGTFFPQARAPGKPFLNSILKLKAGPTVGDVQCDTSHNEHIIPNQIWERGELFSVHRVHSWFSGCPGMRVWTVRPRPSGQLRGTSTPVIHRDKDWVGSSSVIR